MTGPVMPTIEPPPPGAVPVATTSAKKIARRETIRLLMRRPEIEGFISIAPPANRFDFSFLAPCPSSGLFVHGDQDRVAPIKEVMGLIEKLKTQKGIAIEHAVVPGANHFFENKVEPLIAQVGTYLDKRLGNPPKIAVASRAEQIGRD